MYKHKAWVAVDGDDSGLAVVKSLREKFKDWPSDRFEHWSEPCFEKYYPARFSKEVKEALSIQNKGKLREAKRLLLQQLLDWMADNTEEARREIESSAAEVIAYLRRVESQLTGGSAETQGACNV
ncbi:hypothetical protein ABZS86_35785 [Streptomyces sp. NPDC005355]|uniref:hypothetical protein n=1 Tax=Streptomyces sp. NPDC005355 TaxID=3157038 RepID=UPI0033B9BF45